MMLPLSTTVRCACHSFTGHRHNTHGRVPTRPFVLGDAPATIY